VASLWLIRCLRSTGTLSLFSRSVGLLCLLFFHPSVLFFLLCLLIIFSALICLKLETFLLLLPASARVYPNRFSPSLGRQRRWEPLIHSFLAHRPSSLPLPDLNSFHQLFLFPLGSQPPVSRNYAIGTDPQWTLSSAQSASISSPSACHLNLGLSSRTLPFSMSSSILALCP